MYVLGQIWLLLLLTHLMNLLLLFVVIIVFSALRSSFITVSSSPHALHRSIYVDKMSQRNFGTWAILHIYNHN